MNQTVHSLKSFARQHRRAALAVIAAAAFAKVEAERVAAYILPVFAGFTFAESDGTPITGPEHLYCCEDAELCARYYAACDKAHRANGFTGPAGHCPALVADYARVKAENAFLVPCAAFMGVSADGLYGKSRAEALHIFLGACVKSSS